jgi:hypothetical protein
LLKALSGIYSDFLQVLVWPLVVVVLKSLAGFFFYIFLLGTSMISFNIMFVERLGVINIFLLLIYSLIKKEVKMEEGATMKDVVVAVMVDQFLAKFLLLD